MRGRARVWPGSGDQDESACLLPTLQLSRCSGAQPPGALRVTALRKPSLSVTEARSPWGPRCGAPFRIYGTGTSHALAPTPPRVSSPEPVCLRAAAPMSQSGQGAHEEHSATTTAVGRICCASTCPAGWASGHPCPGPLFFSFKFPKPCHPSCALLITARATLSFRDCNASIFRYLPPTSNPFLPTRRAWQPVSGSPGAARPPRPRSRNRPQGWPGWCAPPRRWADPPPRRPTGRAAKSPKPGARGAECTAGS